MTDPFYTQKAKQREVIKTIHIVNFIMIFSMYFILLLFSSPTIYLDRLKKKQWRAFTLWLIIFSAITWLVSYLVRNTAERSSIRTMTNPAKVWRSYITSSVWAPFQSWSDSSSSALWRDKTRPHLWSQSSSPSQAWSANSPARSSKVHTPMWAQPAHDSYLSRVSVSEPWASPATSPAAVGPSPPSPGAGLEQQS